MNPKGFEFKFTELLYMSIMVNHLQLHFLPEKVEMQNEQNVTHCTESGTLKATISQSCFWYCLVYGSEINSRSDEPSGTQKLVSRWVIQLPILFMRFLSHPVPVFTLCSDILLYPSCEFVHAIHSLLQKSAVLHLCLSNDDKGEQLLVERSHGKIITQSTWSTFIFKSP